jgi:hypothetical protein
LTEHGYNKKENRRGNLKKDCLTCKQGFEKTFKLKRQTDSTARRCCFTAARRPNRPNATAFNKEEVLMRAAFFTDKDRATTGTS